MSNELVIQEWQHTKELGKHVADSGLFKDANEVAAAIVKIQWGKDIGIPPTAALAGIHIIQGKPELSSNLIAGLIKSSGKYDYDVIEKSEKQCQLEFHRMIGTRTAMGTETFTWADAERAGIIKETWKKYPKSMLFARCLTAGARTYCPDVFLGGVYAEGEISDAIEPKSIPKATVVEVKENTPPLSPEPKAQIQTLKDRQKSANEYWEKLPKETSDIIWAAGVKRFGNDLPAANQFNEDQLAWLRMIAKDLAKDLSPENAEKVCQDLELVNG